MRHITLVLALVAAACGSAPATPDGGTPPGCAPTLTHESRAEVVSQPRFDPSPLCYPPEYVAWTGLAPSRVERSVQGSCSYVYTDTVNGDTITETVATEGGEVLGWRQEVDLGSDGVVDCITLLQPAD